MEPMLLTPAEVAEVLGISKSYVYELLASNTLQSITIGRARRIPRRALEDFVATRAAAQDGYVPGPAPVRRDSLPARS